MSNEILWAIGALLASASRILNGETTLRLTRPRRDLAFTCVLGIIAAFFSILRVLFCAFERQAHSRRVSRNGERQLCHPPQSWAAP